MAPGAFIYIQSFIQANIYLSISLSISNIYSIYVHWKLVFNRDRLGSTLYSALCVSTLYNAVVCCSKLKYAV